MAEIVDNLTLINEEYFKANCPIPINYDIAEIKPYFHVAEKLWIEPVLGTPLYEEILYQVADNKLTPENSTLLLEIYPYEAFSICYEALPFIAYHFSEVGVTKGKSENSESISGKDIDFMSNHLRTQVEIMKNNLKKFLEGHSEFYPLFRSGDVSSDEEFFIQDVPNIEKYKAYKQRVLNKLNSKKPNTNQMLYTTKRFDVSLD